MATLQEVKKRITSIEKTKKITNAMQMVAGAKLYKATEKLNAIRSTFDELYGIMNRTKIELYPNENILLQGKKDVKNKGLIVLSSDKGLCGSFNTFIFKELSAFIEKEPNLKTFVIGKKGVNFFNKTYGKPFKKKIDYLAGADFKQSSKFYEKIKELYLDDTLDEVYILYNQFYSTIKQQPIIKRIFPIYPLQDFEGVDKTDLKQVDALVEPDKESILENILNLYGKSFFFKCFCESIVSEESARMNAMKAATDNAVDMIADLTLSYNRVRQAQITTQIVEIIGAAEAL